MFFFSDEVCVESRLTPCVVVKFCHIAWGDFHARSRFARSTILEEKGRLLVVHPRVTNISFLLTVSLHNQEKRF